MGQKLSSFPHQCGISFPAVKQLVWASHLALPIISGERRTCSIHLGLERVHPEASTSHDWVYRELQELEGSRFQYSCRQMTFTAGEMKNTQIFAQVSLNLFLCLHFWGWLLIINVGCTSCNCNFCRITDWDYLVSEAQFLVSIRIAVLQTVSFKNHSAGHWVSFFFLGSVGISNVNILQHDEVSVILLWRCLELSDLWGRRVLNPITLHKKSP